MATIDEIYKNVLCGAVYGRKAKFPDGSEYFHWAIWRSGKYIYFESYGRWAHEANFEDFKRGFKVAWENANTFLKEHYLIGW